MAELSMLIASLARMDNGKVTAIMRREASAAAKPFVPRVRAAILNIPTTGPVHTGLRERIARCVETWSSINGPVAKVGIEVNSSRMPDGQMSLPLGMEGAKRWRHPLFGDREHWYTQMPHPYWQSGTAGYGAAQQNAIERAAQQIADTINRGAA
jgi:hypothetical protein